MIRIYKYGEVPNSEIFERENISADVEDVVAEIINNVKKNGDRALSEYTLKFDKADITGFEVSSEEIDEAFKSVEPEFIEILKEAAENIRTFHEKQKHTSFIINEKDGVVTGQKIIPIEKVGIYVPGGTAAYPSTVLMDSIPAKIARCEQIVMTTPPMKNGKINPVILAAAKIAGVDNIYKVGGAQAIAAFAYGTETIPKVDKIVGPGNAYVSEAKKQVFGMVSIEMIAGPSEILVVADATNDPEIIAADMLSQAEHDMLASAILVTDSTDFSKAVSDELERQIPLLPRAEIARISIENNSKIIVVENDILKAIDIANVFAPEHLELCVDNPFDYLDKIKHAGSIFLGKNCPEALGDYFAGPNHTLPTMGTARFSSALSVDDFVKKSQYIYFSKEALEKVANKISYFANKEGLAGHGISATVRFKK